MILLSSRSSNATDLLGPSIRALSRRGISRARKVSSDGPVFTTHFYQDENYRLWCAVRLEVIKGSNPSRGLTVWKRARLHSHARGKDKTSKTVDGCGRDAITVGLSGVGAQHNHQSKGERVSGVTGGDTDFGKGGRQIARPRADGRGAHFGD